MLTPQEVAERAFPKASFGGYNMAQVDEFLDMLTPDYTALYNENAVLKSKMKVLVEKVEEYRSTEEAMRKALMTAQRMADDLVQEAESKRDAILQEAEEAARQKLASLKDEQEAEAFRLTEAQKKTADFVEKVRALQTKQLEYLAQLSQLCPVPPSPAQVEQEETVDEIDGNVQRLVEQAMIGATVENLNESICQEPRDVGDTAEFAPVAAEAQAQQDAEEEDDKKTVRVDFGNLQFGKDYELE